MAKYYCKGCELYWDDPKDSSSKCPSCDQPGTPREQIFTYEEMKPKPVTVVVDTGQRITVKLIPKTIVFLEPTTHGVPQFSDENIIAMEPDAKPVFVEGHSACLIVEYAPFESWKTGKYEEECLGHVQDAKQQAYLKVASALKNVNIIGADGRKAYNKEEIHSLSIRYGKEGSSFKFGEFDFKDIRVGLSSYAKISLSLSGDKLPPLLVEMVAYLKNPEGYSCKPAPGFVLGLVSSLVVKESKPLSDSHRNAIHDAVMLGYDRDLNTNYKIPGGNEFEKELDERMDQYKKDKAEVTREQVSELLEMEQEEPKLHAVNACHCAISNLLLFTRVLSSKCQIIVTAFGEEHIKDLRVCLDKVGIAYKNGPLVGWKK